MNDIEQWAKLYEATVTDAELYEAVSDNDILSNVFSSLLAFMNGKGDKILKDSEWMNYLINDIEAAAHKKLFKMNSDDQANLKEIVSKQYGEEE